MTTGRINGACGFLSNYERSAQAGFDQHLVKPVDPCELARLLGESAVEFAGTQV